MEKKKSIFVLCQRFGFLSLLSYCLMAVLHLAITSSSSVSVCLPAAAAGFDHLNICGYFYFQPPLHFIVASMRRSVIRREMFSSVSLPPGELLQNGFLTARRQDGDVFMKYTHLYFRGEDLTCSSNSKTAIVLDVYVFLARKQNKTGKKKTQKFGRGQRSDAKMQQITN